MGKFDHRHLKLWKKMLSEAPESAMCEASTRELLESNGVCVNPGEDIVQGSGGADFHCTVGTNAFLVEVTCIKKATATKKTGISEEPGMGGMRPFALMEQVYGEVQGKTGQIAKKNPSVPVLVAIGTFHGFVTMLQIDKMQVSSLATGTPRMAWQVNTRDLVESDPFQQIELKVQRREDGTNDGRPPVFMKQGPDHNPMPTRNLISGLLVCGFGVQRRFGVINPYATHSFQEEWLPQIEFCQSNVDFDAGTISAVWGQTKQ